MLWKAGVCCLKWRLKNSSSTVLLRSQHKEHTGGRTCVFPSPVECSFPVGSIRHRIWPLKLSPAPTDIYKPDCRNFGNSWLCHTTSEIIQQIGLPWKSLAWAWLSLKTEMDCSQQLLGIYAAWGSLITSHAGQRIKMLPYYRSVKHKVIQLNPLNAFVFLPHLHMLLASPREMTCFSRISIFPFQGRIPMVRFEGAACSSSPPSLCFLWQHSGADFLR